MSLSPRSFTEADFNEFFDRAKQMGSVVSWSGDWQQLGQENAAPEVIADLAKRYGYEPVYIATVFNTQSGLIRPLDAAGIAEYVQMAVDFARAHKPLYLGLGIEVNLLYERWPDEFEKFVRLFNETYDLVKQVSPDTQVFTVMQLEHMKGLHGGLFGGVSDPDANEWQLLDRFARADFIAFTTYPCIIFRTPAEIPSDYYSVIGKHTTKPIAFSEIGWPASLSVAGWESNEAEQKDFVQRFFTLTSALTPRFAIWSFLFDQILPEPFRALGLIREDGTPRPAFDAWVAHAR